ncbi:unnamed protein product [Moneuplotes crassus]|uniref:Uncharacterized protein n=1 Tax=Euplotes crassus TaxID=5936 RepID=A0AAD1UJ01_EUPCR|nr:unnamed protein product [Moneuplotes crassus]
MEGSISNIRLITLIVLMLAASSSHGIILKFMDTVEVDGEPFEHPFFQTLAMFIGNSFCMLIYLYIKRQSIQKYGSIEESPTMRRAIASGLKTKINPAIFVIPMLIDAASSTMFY